MVKKVLKLAALLAPVVFVVGCATQKAKPYDYRAFEASNPHSILVLPPLNNSLEVGATESVYSTVTYPLAEAGYYVLPVALVNETFKQNGLTTPADIHNVAPEKLREIFGADAALYMTVDRYGSTYQLLSSVTEVSAGARLVDLKTKALLWDGRATVIDTGGTSNDLLTALVQAAVTQIVNSTNKRSHEIAAKTNGLLLRGGGPQGMLYGPRSPKYTGRDATIPVAEATAAPRNDKKAAAPAKRSAQSTAVMVPAPVADTAVSPVPAAQPVAAPVAEPVAVVAPLAIPVAPAAKKVAVVAPPAAPAAPAAKMPASVPMPAPAIAPVLAPAPAPAVQANAAEQIYADALARAQTKYQSLNPGSAWYRQELYDWVMDRKDEYVKAGKAPDVALKLALAAMEGR